MKCYLAVALLVIGTAKTGSASADTVLRYEFLPAQSTVVQTGGFLGVYETYSVEGEFQLRVDHEGGVASFERVDATLGPPSPFLPTESLGGLFHMTELAGTVIDESTIDFVGQLPSERVVDINIEATFQDDLISLTGGFDGNQGGGADFFVYELSAVGLVIPEPASLWLLAAAVAAWIAIDRRWLARQSCFPKLR